jgi:hypothetical protein
MPAVSLSLSKEICHAWFSRTRHFRAEGAMVNSLARRLVTSFGLMAVAAAVILPAGAASASSSAFWVSPGGAAGKADVSCATAAFSTVSSAVTAAESAHSGAVPTVEVCPGLYSEQVTILKSLVLTRAPVSASLGAATIQLPASVGSNQATGLSSTNCQAQDGAEKVSLPQSVIEVCAARSGGANTTGTKVTVSGLTVEGNWPGSVCYDSLYDVLVEGGASLSLTGSTVEKAGAVSPLSGCQGGVAVEAGNSSTSQIGHVDLSSDTIESYQKNGITVDGSGSSGDISRVVVTGAGPTSAIAQNGIQISDGATGSATDSSVSGNNYTGSGGASSTGILVFGGCGSPLVDHASFTGNKLTGNDIGIALANYDATCTKSAPTPTDDLACYNVIKNSNGYPGGKPSADANVTGWTSASPVVGYQAGVSDAGNHDVICDNVITGAGYAPLDAASTLPHPPPPAFVRPVDIVSTPAIAPKTGGNTFDGLLYFPA